MPDGFFIGPLHGIFLPHHLLLESLPVGISHTLLTPLPFGKVVWGFRAL